VTPLRSVTHAQALCAGNNRGTRIMAKSRQRFAGSNRPCFRMLRLDRQKAQAAGGTPQRCRDTTRPPATRHGMKQQLLSAWMP